MRNSKTPKYYNRKMIEADIEAAEKECRELLKDLRDAKSALFMEQKKDRSYRKMAREINKIKERLSECGSYLQIDKAQTFDNEIKKNDGENEFSIKILDDKSIQIHMPLIPCRGTSGSEVLARIDARMVRDLMISYMNFKNITAPIFDCAEIEYRHFFGPEKENFNPRDLDNIYTKPVTDCLLGLVYPDDNYNIIPKQTYRGMKTQNKSYTELIIREHKKPE